MKKIKCKPVHREVSCLKFADYSVTDSSLLNIVPVRAMRVNGNTGISPLILNIGTKSGVWSVLCPGHFTPSEKEPTVHAE